MFEFERLKQLAKEKRYSMTDLADLCGKQRTFFYDVKNKGVKVGVETYNKLSELLETTPEYLNGESDEPHPKLDTNTQDLVDVYRIVSSRPTTKILFSALKDATDEDIQQCLEILKALKATNGR